MFTFLVVALVAAVVLLIITALSYFSLKDKYDDQSTRVAELEYFVSEKDKALTKCIFFLKALNQTIE